MGQETFKAGAQYDDFKGSVAADNLDLKTFRDYLNANGHIKPEEVLVGIEVWSGATKGQPLSVRAIMAKGSAHENIADAVATGSPLSVRKVHLEFSPEEFLAFFKRFSICMSAGRGLIDGIEIISDE